MVTPAYYVYDLMLDVTVYDCPLAQQHADLSCAMQTTPVIQHQT